MTCLILDQFYRIKNGDRFWYENGGPQGFSLNQLNEIRKTTLANVLCDNSDGLDLIQPKVMETKSDKNSYVPCSELARPNFQYWKENLHIQKLSRDSDNTGVLDEEDIFREPY